MDDAKPASPTDGQGWAYKRIQEGDQICKANQTLHTAAADLIAKIPKNRVYRPKVANPLYPSTFVNRIRVPVFMACQFNDEQTGAHCPYLADRFTGTRGSGSPSPTASTSTRSTLRRSTAGSTSWSSTSPGEDRSTRRRHGRRSRR